MKSTAVALQDKAEYHIYIRQVGEHGNKGSRPPMPEHRNIVRTEIIRCHTYCQMSQGQ
jgi:hypothetical protein